MPRNLKRKRNAKSKTKSKSPLKPKVNKRQKTGESSIDVKVQDVAHKMRIDSIEMTNASGSGHPTSCSSMAELISTLFFHPKGMKINSKVPRSFANDKFILSKG